MKRNVLRVMLCGVVWGGVSAGVCGCTRPLLSPQETRSPFDAYDSQRGQYAQQKVPDTFGRDRPNLGQRLAPKY